MEAIVLAGGLGTRLRKVVKEVPKPMAPILGRPFLEILLFWLSRKGFTRVVLSLGYLSEKITRHFGERFFGMEVIYVIEEQPLGTGGAIRLAFEYCLQDKAFIFNGDTFLDLDVDKVEKKWADNQSPIVVGRKVQEASRYGQILTEQGRIVSFKEKHLAGPGLINGGCYVLPKEIVADFPANSSFSFEKDFLTSISLSENFEVFVSDGAFIDIGTPEDYERSHDLLRELVIVMDKQN